MSILSLIFGLILILWAIWGFVIFKFMSEMMNKNLKYMLEPRVNYMSKSLTGARYDAINIRKWEVYFGAIVLAPLRVLVSLPIFGIMYAIVWSVKRYYGGKSLTIKKFPLLFTPKIFPNNPFIVTIDNNQIPRGKLYEKLTQFGNSPIFMWRALNCLGVSVKKVKHSLHDFIADYKPKQDINIAPMAVCNHVSPWLDHFYFVSEPFSFVARYLMSQVFYVGMFTQARQCLCFRKGSRKERAMIVPRVKERIEKIMDGELPPIFIYPEGTTTNGMAFLTFKKGGFCHLKPLKIFVIQYHGRFLNSFTNVHPLAATFISLGQLYNGITVHEVEEALDPLWIAEKHGVDPNDPEFWKLFAEETRKIMGWIGDIHLSDEGFQQLIEFEKGESRKHFKISIDVCNREGKKKGVKVVEKRSQLQEALDKKEIVA